MNIIRPYINRTRLVLGGLFFIGLLKAFLGRRFLFIAKFGLGGVHVGEHVEKNVRGVRKILTYDAAMNLVDTTTYVLNLINDFDNHINNMK